MKTALITGITGQDGSYLTELLLNKGYRVHGLIRRSSSFNTGRLDTVYQDPHVEAARLHLHYGDLSDSSMLASLIRRTEPQEIYHLGAQSHVRVSFDMPEYTADVSALSCIRLLEAIRDAKVACRFYQASSSEMFGSSPPPQNENTPFAPQSPYAIAKLHAYWTTVNYRQGYGMFAVNGILFNHESERRGQTFVTRKITRAVARIVAGRQKELFLGNLDAQRDWGYAKEYVEAMWLMLQADQPRDYVIATNTAFTVRDLCRVAFDQAGLKWEDHVVSDQRFHRPTEIAASRGDYSRAKNDLGWEPRTSFEQLIRLMVDADVKLLSERG